MLNLNLLSQKDKENIKFEELRRLIIFVSLFSIIIFIFFSVILLPAYFMTTFEKKSLRRELKIAERSDRVANTEATESDISVLNKIFQKVAEGKNQVLIPSGFIEQLIDDTDRRIFFSQVSYKSRKEIFISGFAATRHDLLAFESKIRNHNFLKDVSSPITNIIKESNINFTIKAVPLF